MEGGREREKKRYGVLLCAEDSEYVKSNYGGYFGVFLNMLGEDGENWDLYRVVSDHFPLDDDLQLYDGFVITGSCSDAHGDDAWICRLISLVRKLDSLKKKILGVCFGHQILGRALGGKTGRAISSWDIGLRTVHFSASSSKLFSTLQVPAMLSIIECHQDEVLELPGEAEVIAWSNKTAIEMFKYGDHIMGVQGHPEYTLDILLHLLARLLDRNLILESHANEVREKLLESHGPDKEAWRTLCLNFLKGNPTKVETIEQEVLELNP